MGQGEGVRGAGDGRSLQAAGTAIIDTMIVWTAAAECWSSDMADIDPPCTLTAQTHNNVLDDIDSAILYAYAALGIDAFLRVVDAHPGYDHEDFVE